MSGLEIELDSIASRTAFSGVVRIDGADGIEVAKAYGLAHRGYEISNEVDTRFAIASGTKGLTALAVVSLIEDGLFELSTAARSVLGEDLPLIGDRVTIEHLLSHRSGIGDYLDEEAGHELSEYLMPVSVHELVTTASTRDLPKSSLELTEDRSVSRSETHVARQHELAACPADAPFDLRDRDQPTRAQIVEQGRYRRLAGQLGRFGSIFGYSSQVDVRDEVVGVRALEHDDFQRVVSFGEPDERDDVPNELGSEKVHRRRVDLREEHGSFDARLDGVHEPTISLFRFVQEGVHVCGELDAELEEKTVSRVGIDRDPGVR